MNSKTSRLYFDDDATLMMDALDALEEAREAELRALLAPVTPADEDDFPF